MEHLFVVPVGNWSSHLAMKGTRQPHNGLFSQRYSNRPWFFNFSIECSHERREWGFVGSLTLAATSKVQEIYGDWYHSNPPVSSPLKRWKRKTDAVRARPQA
jgi:hypothetical protein